MYVWGLPYICQGTKADAWYIYIWFVLYIYSESNNKNYRSWWKILIKFSCICRLWVSWTRCGWGSLHDKPFISHAQNQTAKRIKKHWTVFPMGKFLLSLIHCMISWSSRYIGFFCLVHSTGLVVWRVWIRCRCGWTEIVGLPPSRLEVVQLYEGLFSLILLGGYHITSKECRQRRAWRDVLYLCWLIDGACIFLLIS